MIVLDTNVVSALMRPTVDASVERWLAIVPREDLFMTAITRAEIRYGIARLPHGRRRDDLSDRADRLFREAASRVLVFDDAAADAFGVIVAGREAIGRPTSVQDAQIAAIARARNATVAVRNVADFEYCGVEIVNPWDASAG